MIHAGFVHWCIHVLDLDASVGFYEEALGMHVAKTVGPTDGSWSNTYLENENVPFQIELTYNQDRIEPYDNCGRDAHIAFVVADVDKAHAQHQDMGIIVHENPDMNVYFIADPDGNWIEIIPA